MTETARAPLPAPATPSGAYVHLPYCRSRCGYCAFVVSTDTSSSDAYRDALARELSLVEPEAKGFSFDSLYLGGGTPSRTPVADLAALLEDLRRRLNVLDSVEVTLEANPEDVTSDAARSWSSAGVNRVSVGVQSFDDAELSAVGRRHDAAAAARALAILLDLGFSVSADLILGLPGQTRESFRRSVDRLLRSGAAHVSVYLLEAEKSKTIEEDRRRHPASYLSDDAQAEAWLELGQALARAGFRHYEISNWALPGRESRHNTKYWRRIPTLGLGVSAHELWSGRRRANVSSLTRYLEELEAGRRPVALDRALGGLELLQERIVLGLRLSEGLPAQEVEDYVRRAADADLPGDFAAWQEEGLIEKKGGRLRMTERGYLLSNEILCRFV